MATIIQEIVHLKPEAFETGRTRVVAAELNALDRRLVERVHHRVPIGFGRQESSDPWLGVPVDRGQISGARVIVEATRPEMQPDLSQGSHLPHKVISFKVLYLSVHHTDGRCIDWDRLNKHEVVNETRFRLRLASHVLIKVQGRTGRGVIRYG